LKNQYPLKRENWLEKEHSKTFGQWLRKEVHYIHIGVFHIGLYIEA